MTQQQPPRRPVPQCPHPGSRPSYGRPNTPRRRGPKPNIFVRAFDTIRGNVLLRNLVLAVCAIVIGTFIINLLLGLYTRHGQKYSVPNLIGSTVNEAVGAASEGSLRLEVIDSLYMPKQRPGAILDQSPKPGMSVKSGRRVFLTVNAFRPRMEMIPYVTGLSLRQAKSVLENKGFEIERLVYRTDIATNNVLGESWNGKEVTKTNGVEAELGSGIVLTVGMNPSDPLPQTPKVIGLTLREAKSRLWEVGLNLGEVKYDRDVDAENLEDARIYRQDPPQERRSHYGNRITLWLTADAQKISSSSTAADAAARQTAVDEEPESEDLTGELPEGDL